MVPSNFKQNVKENANLVIEKTREDNKQREKIYCSGKVNFS
jgi:hypothetical protein